MISIETNGEDITVSFSVRDLLESYPGSMLERSLLESTGNTAHVVDRVKFAEAVAHALTEDDEIGGCKLDVILDQAMAVAMMEYDENGIEFQPSAEFVET